MTCKFPMKTETQFSFHKVFLEHSLPHWLKEVCVAPVLPRELSNYNRDLVWSSHNSACCSEDGCHSDTWQLDRSVHSTGQWFCVQCSVIIYLQVSICHIKMRNKMAMGCKSFAFKAKWLIGYFVIKLEGKDCDHYSITL